MLTFVSPRLLLSRLLSRPLTKGGLVYLDADGVLWPDEDQLLISKKFHIPKININEIRRIKESGFGIVVVSNQTGYSSGRVNFFSFFFLIFLNAIRLIALGFVDVVFICVHHPHSQRHFTRKNCRCRKPNPTMLISGSKYFSVPEDSKILIGDRISDIQAGLNAGIKKNILVLNSRCLEQNIAFNDSKRNSTFFQIADNLSEAIDITLSDKITSKYSVLVLSAGRGERLRPLTDEVPKPLLPIQDSTILLRLIHQIFATDQDSRVFINISYLANKFLNYLNLNLSLSQKQRIVISYEPEMLGTAISLQECLNFSSNPTLVIHGDLVVESLGYAEIHRILCSSNQHSVICHTRPAAASRSVLEISGGFVISFQEGQYLKRISLRNQTSLVNKNEVHVNSGIYWFLPDKFIQDLKFNKGGSIPSEVLPRLIKSVGLRAVPSDFARVSVDSFEALDMATQLAQKYPISHN